MQSNLNVDNHHSHKINLFFLLKFMLNQRDRLTDILFHFIRIHFIHLTNNDNNMPLALTTTITSFILDFIA